MLLVPTPLRRSLLLSCACLAAGHAALLHGRAREHAAARFDVDETEHACTQEELARYEAEVNAYDQKKSESHRRLEEADHNRTLANLAHAAALLEPLLAALQESRAAAERDLRPAGARVVKWALQRILKVPVPEASRVDLGVDIPQHAELWSKNTSVEVEAILQRGLSLFDASLDRAARAEFPGLRYKLYRGPLPRNGKELITYVAGKAVPMLTLEYSPELARVARLLLKMPKDAKDVQPFVMTTLLPELLATMPQVCQPQRLMTTLTFSPGDVGKRLATFVERCKQEVEETKAPLKGPPPPVKRCLTCEEQYNRQTTDKSSPQSCASHCDPVFGACLMGVSDDCLRKFVPCTRCHKNKLMQLDECRGQQRNQLLIDKLGSLVHIFKSATVEQSGLDSFATAAVGALLG